MTKATQNGKPKKPYPDFPLFAHASGRWCKRIKGRFHYFGKWGDGWKKALARYQAERDYLYAGEDPPTNPDSTWTVKALCSEHHATGDAGSLSASEPSEDEDAAAES